jgi:S-DNA-T family DNA segregation ATPase FtsK/SpoIIIE
VLTDLGIQPEDNWNYPLDRPLPPAAHVIWSKADQPPPADPVPPGGWRLVRLDSPLAGSEAPLRDARWALRVGQTKRGRVRLRQGEGPRAWLGRVRQSRAGKLKTSWRPLTWPRAAGAGDLLRFASGEVFALIRQPLKTGSEHDQRRRGRGGMTAGAVSSLVMCGLMYLVTRNLMWSLMPLAGVLASVLPGLMRRHRQPWFEGVGGLDPEAPSPFPDCPTVELIGRSGPVAALTRRLVAGAAPELAFRAEGCPSEPDWAWTRFLPTPPPSTPAITLRPTSSGIRLEAPASGRANVKRLVVRDAGLGLMAARGQDGTAYKAVGWGTEAMEDLARGWAADAGGAPPPAAIATTPREIAASWQVGAMEPVGFTATGEPVTINLATAGPHALVAGTSGSGKSEFLRALILAEALATPPDQLAVVGLDHKGGATFRDLEHLPHVVGVATDLDAQGTARTLTSLEAELASRERLLEEAGVTGWHELPPGRRPWRLLVVVDEFRTLLDSLPAAEGRLERLAAQGRSLGMGLILATQRPAGAVSAQLRANLALRFCFRVATEADSLDVLGTADAAAIDPATPGVCIVATAGRLPVRFRVRRLPPPPRRSAVPVSWPEAWAAPTPATPQTSRLVDAISQAAANGGLKPPEAPWRPPLPDRLTLVHTDRHHDLVPLGLADLPQLQRQEPLVWDPKRGHLAILGAPRSGRTTAALAAAAGLAQANWATHVVTHRADLFAGLTGLPAFGGVIDARSAERVTELINLLGGQPHDTKRALVVDAATEIEALGSAALGRPLLDALTGGALAPGAAVVVTGPAKPARWLSACPYRLVLATAEVTDDYALGIPRELASARTTPGRACFLGPEAAFLTQIALTPADLLTRQAVVPLAPPPRVLDLPDRVDSSDLPPNLDPAMIWVGLGGAYGTPLALPVTPGRTIGLIGPHGSGRSTALAAIHRALSHAGRPATLFGSSAKREWNQIGEALSSGQVVLVDDVESVAGTCPSQMPAAGTLVAAFTTTTAASFRPPANLLHANPLGVLLWPSHPGSASAFGPLARSSMALESGPFGAAEPPGRGRLVDLGRSHAIQLAA